MTIQNTFEILKNHFGERWSTSQTDLENHGHSESYFPTHAPDAVVYPLTTADVVYIVNVCHQSKIPIIGMPSFLASATARDSILVSIMKIKSGVFFISAIPPRDL